jgi:hypothetical protein
MVLVVGIVMVVPLLVKFVGFILLVVGSVFEKVGTVAPAKLAKEVVAPCPKTF